MSENLSVPMQTPLVGLSMDADTAHYVGILEGTIAALCINECKYRALLELYTGESWEASRIDVNGSVLMDLAVSSLIKQTGMDRVRARILVSKRWNQYNQEAPAVIPKAVPVEEFTPETPVSDAVATELVTPVAASMSERFQDWKARQLASAADILEEDVLKATVPQDLSND